MAALKRIPIWWPSNSTRIPGIATVRHCTLPPGFGQSRPNCGMLSRYAVDPDLLEDNQFACCPRRNCAMMNASLNEFYSKIVLLFSIRKLSFVWVMSGNGYAARIYWRIMRQWICTLHRQKTVRWYFHALDWLLNCCGHVHSWSLWSIPVSCVIRIWKSELNSWNLWLKVKASRRYLLLVSVPRYDPVCAYAMHPNSPKQNCIDRTITCRSTSDGAVSYDFWNLSIESMSNCIRCIDTWFSGRAFGSKAFFKIWSCIWI